MMDGLDGGAVCSQPAGGMTEGGGSLASLD